MSKQKKPGWRDAACIVIAVLALLLFKAVVAGYVAVVHVLWEPETKWQWACLNAVLGSASTGLLTQSLCYAAIMFVPYFIGGAVLGAIVEPDMGFMDVFMWPL